jgi:hypothetical protein
MLLAREAVNLDRSPQTEGSLLATLQRRPAVIASVALASDGPPQQVVASPDGRTLAVSAVGLRFYDARTLSIKGRSLIDFDGARAPVYSGGGSLLAYPTGPTDVSTPFIAVRDAQTLRLAHKLALDPLQLAGSVPNLADASILIAPDRSTVYGLSGVQPR